MDYFKIILVSLFSLAALFILTRLMGNKQISQMTMFDYVIGISIGSIAAEMATELESPLKPLVAMAVYAVAALMISIVSSKFIRIRRVMLGRSIVLMRNGRLIRENFKRAKLDLSEFLIQCRIDGYFDLSAVNIAVLEPNGKVSFLPFADKRPATPEDLKIVPGEEPLFYHVIMDGRILDRNLQASGHNRAWLTNELKAQGIPRVTDVFFAQLDHNGTLHIFENETGRIQNDPFE